MFPRMNDNTGICHHPTFVLIKSFLHQDVPMLLKQANIVSDVGLENELSNEYACVCGRLICIILNYGCRLCASSRVWITKETLNCGHTSFEMLNINFTEFAS